jgi:hypothetical protein
LNLQYGICVITFVGYLKEEVRWDKEGTVREGDYNFHYGKGNENHQLGNRFFCTPKNSISS